MLDSNSTQSLIISSIIVPIDFPLGIRLVFGCYSRDVLYKILGPWGPRPPIQVSHGSRRLGRQSWDDLQSGLLLRRLGLHSQAVEEGRQQHLHREGGDHAYQRSGPGGPGGTFWELFGNDRNKQPAFLGDDSSDWLIYGKASHGKSLGFLDRWSTKVDPGIATGWHVISQGTHDGLTGRHRSILHVLGLVIGGLAAQAAWMSISVWELDNSKDDDQPHGF